MQQYIYTLSDPVTKQVRYVGKTNNLQQRKQAHQSRSRYESTHKRNWINSLHKRGLQPIMEIVEIVESVEWKFWEQYWIAQFKAWGFDLTNYGEGGEGLSKGNQTSFKKGEGSLPVVQIDYDGNLVQRFNSVTEAIEITGHKHISSVLKGTQRSAGKCIWLYESDYNKSTIDYINQLIERAQDFSHRGGKETRFKKGESTWNKGTNGYKLNGKKKARAVLQINTLDKIIDTFDSYTEAGKAFGCDPEGIRRCLQGKSKRAQGYIWKYKDEYYATPSGN